MDDSRRRFKRAQVSFTAWGETRSLPDEKHPFDALTRDVAARGTCLILSQPNGFEQGQKIRFGIELLQGDVPIEAHGMIRWIGYENEAREKQLMGVELTGMRTVHDYERWLEMLTFFGI